MKRLSAALLPALAVSLTFVAAQGQGSKPLDIYIVDTEGGKAALFVSPTGQSLLIDSGNPGGRDTDRIMAAVNEAGLKQIDFLISTHYHVDHIGGMAERQAHPGRDLHRPRPSVEERSRWGFQRRTPRWMEGEAPASRAQGTIRCPPAQPTCDGTAAPCPARAESACALHTEGDHQRSENAHGRERRHARPVPACRLRRPVLE